MSLAEDLLNSLPDEPVATFGLNPETEPHIVINPDRTVTVPESLLHIAVEGDHNIETVTFDCPRYWDGHDLSRMRLRIVFQRPDGHREPHLAENVRVDPDDTNVIHFDWTLSNNVTLVRGNISFTVCAKLTNAEGVSEREWHTRLNQDLVVDEGMDCSGDEIIEQNPDILESILVRLDTLESSGGTGSNSGDYYYNCQEYGVTPSNADNTAAMQALIDAVHAKGGGVIWIPVGTYRFNCESSNTHNGSARACLAAKNGVSIIGESNDKTIIKMYGNDLHGAAWIGSPGHNTVTTGCTYERFTVDMADVTMDSYHVGSKAIFIVGLQNCTFRDLRLLNTPATALGADILFNVVIDSVCVRNGGRLWTEGVSGGSGIGIGTGAWENENFVIRNCVCDNCGQYGIFIEDQGIFAGPVKNYPAGQIIANNVVRSGRNYGIGIRGGKNVLITGNNVYKNRCGINLDYGAKNVMVTGNIIAESTDAGLELGSTLVKNYCDAQGVDSACENVVVRGNAFFDNACNVLTTTAPIDSQIESDS